MPKIIQFIDDNIPFLRDTYHRAVSELCNIDNSIVTGNYLYDDLKQK